MAESISGEGRHGRRIRTHFYSVAYCRPLEANVIFIIKSALRILSYKFQVSFKFILIHSLTKAQYKKSRLETSTWLYKLWSVRAKLLTQQTRKIYPHTHSLNQLLLVHTRYVVTPYIFIQYLGRRQVRLSENLGTKDSSVLIAGDLLRQHKSQDFSSQKNRKTSYRCKANICVDDQYKN